MIRARRNDTSVLADLAKNEKKASERKQRSDMWAKFGHKDDMTTTIFFRLTNGFVGVHVVLEK